MEVRSTDGNKVYATPYITIKNGRNGDNDVLEQDINEYPVLKDDTIDYSIKRFRARVVWDFAKYISLGLITADEVATITAKFEEIATYECEQLRYRDEGAE